MADFENIQSVEVVEPSKVTVSKGVGEPETVAGGEVSPDTPIFIKDTSDLTPTVGSADTGGTHG